MPTTDESPTENTAQSARTDVEEARAIEAIVLVADEPVPPELLAQLLEIPRKRVLAIAADLAEQYAAESRGFVLVHVAGGLRFQTHSDLAPYVERFVLEGQTARLSAAALETLAIVAYKQPVSRAQVSAIRGVSVDGVMRTLENRGYIAEVARDPGPGNAILFGTTPAFLERLGLASTNDLPSLVDFVPDAEVVEALEVGLMFGVDRDTVSSVESRHGDDVIDLGEDGSPSVTVDPMAAGADTPPET